MNQLDATMIYWSIRSAPHVSGNILPISGAWDWDIYSIWYPVVVVGRQTVSGSIALCVLEVEVCWPHNTWMMISTVTCSIMVPDSHMFITLHFKFVQVKCSLIPHIMTNTFITKSVVFLWNIFVVWLKIYWSWCSKCDGTRAETKFRLYRNGWIHLNWRGRHFSRLPASEVSASAVVILDTPCSEVLWRVLATHSIRQFPLHFPSRASPCAIMFQLDSTQTCIETIQVYTSKNFSIMWCDCWVLGVHVTGHCPQ